MPLYDKRYALHKTSMARLLYAERAIFRQAGIFKREGLPI